MREFDFRREAAIMKAVGDLVSAEFPIVFTPTVVNHLVTRNAMVGHPHQTCVPLYLVCGEVQQAYDTMLWWTGHGVC